jgi:hypothetical protein
VRRLHAVVLGGVIAVAVAGAGVARGTYLVDRNPAAPVLQVDSTGHALVAYKEKGVVKRVLVWGAVNAQAPRAGATQVAFKLDYSGGWKALRKANYWKSIKNVCTSARYDGPALPFKVFACKAADGSYWALQEWQRMLPNLGVAPWRPEQSVQELHVSHWTGPLPELTVKTNWVWGGRYEQIVGTYSYDGKPVYGFKATSVGSPLDTWGRNVYLDTFDSPYGAGWKRENSFLAQGANGRFCYSLGPRAPYPGYPASGQRQGNGTKYRLTALGPGVTPIVSVEVPSPGPWDPNDPAKASAENDANTLIQQLGFSATECHT